MPETLDVTTEPKKDKTRQKSNKGGLRRRLTTAELRARNWVETLKKRKIGWGASSHG